MQITLLCVFEIYKLYFLNWLKQDLDLWYFLKWVLSTLVFLLEPVLVFTWLWNHVSDVLWILHFCFPLWYFLLAWNTSLHKFSHAYPSFNVSHPFSWMSIHVFILWAKCGHATHSFIHSWFNKCITWISLFSLIHGKIHFIFFKHFFI